MAYTDSQVMARLKKIRDRAIDEWQRIIEANDADSKNGWKGYAKCIHSMQGAGTEMLQILKIEEAKRANRQDKESTDIRISWMEPPEETEQSN